MACCQAPDCPGPAAGSSPCREKQLATGALLRQRQAQATTMSQRKAMAAQQQQAKARPL